MSISEQNGIGGISRRTLLARNSTGFGLTALAGMLAAQSRDLQAADNRTLLHRSRNRPQRAKSVIFCFMSGGVSAVDTFDPKPRLTLDHGKPMPVPVRPTMFNANGSIMASPWAFQHYGECGLPVSDLFPCIARCADDLAVVRSMTSIANEHAQGNYFLHTGFSLAGYPSAGAWFSYGLGSENENLPGYVVLAGGGSPLGGVGIYGNGFLPAVHQASLLDPDAAEPLTNIRPRESAVRQRRRLQFVEQMDRQQLAQRGNE